MNLARVLMPRLFCLMAAMLLAVSLPDRVRAEGDNQPRKERSYRIGFHFWKPGKIYDEAMSGIRDGLEIADIRYEPVVVYSNQDEDLAVKNLKVLDSMGLDVIYSLSSAGTQVAKKIGMNTPVIASRFPICAAARYHHQPDERKGAAIAVPAQRTGQGSDRHSLTLGQQRRSGHSGSCILLDVRNAPTPSGAGAVCRLVRVALSPVARNRS